LMWWQRKTKTEVREQISLQYHFVHQKSRGLAQARSVASATNRQGRGRPRFHENSE
jgi:hypothetical protein